MKSLVYVMYCFFIALNACNREEVKLLEPSKFECEFVETLLQTKPISYYLNQFGPIEQVRIFDITRTLGTGICSYGTRGVKITDKILLDINTGTYIDFVIYKMKKVNKNKYELEIFYAPHVQNGDCKRRLKMRGVGFVNIMDDSVSIENFKVNIFD